MGAEITGTFSADGNSAAGIATVKTFHNVIASGTFGGGTLIAQISHNGSTWVSGGTNATLTAAGTFNFEIPVGYQYRLNLSGATGPSINYAIGY